jgi:hypothetical protein
MGCIVNKHNKPKQKSPIINIDLGSSKTINAYTENNLSSSEKIIVLKPLLYKNTFSSINNNTYIHSKCSSNIIPCSFNNYVYGKTLIINDYKRCINDINISQHPRNRNNYKTQSFRKLHMD